MAISYPLRPPPPNRFNPVASPSEPRNVSRDRKDIERIGGETPKTNANTMVGPQLEVSE